MKKATRKPPRARRNPHARALRSPLFRGKAVPRADRYRRKPRHPKPPDADGEA